MDPVDPQAIATQVLWAAFGLSLLFGALAQRTHFCTMGAVADIVSMGDWTRMRMWVLAMAVAVLGFNAMVAAGWVEAADSIYAGPRLTWLSALVGGAMFGVGMVLGSGCASKTLIRIGTGNLKSLVVFLVMGLTAYMTLRGVTAVLRVATVETVAVTLPSGQDLPSILEGVAGLSRRTLSLLLGGGLALALFAWVISRPEGRQRQVLVAGVGVGLVIVAVWWVSGVLGHLEEDPNTLEEGFFATNSRRMESLSFVSPTAWTLDWLMLFSDTSRTLTIGVVSIPGMVLGSLAVALVRGEFRWEGFRNAEDTANHLVGGALMGVGGVTALGCTVGQGLTGLSTLAVSSVLALGAILAGAVAALRYQYWRMERLA